MAVRYALFESDGTPAVSIAQDDSEYELWADSLDGLITEAADWLDVGESYVLDRLHTDGKIVVEPGEIIAEGKTFQIVRQEITSVVLTGEDREKLTQLASESESED